jgi:hypothetical protein
MFIPGNIPMPDLLLWLQVSHDSARKAGGGVQVCSARTGEIRQVPSALDSAMILRFTLVTAGAKSCGSACQSVRSVKMAGKAV